MRWKKRGKAGRVLELSRIVHSLENFSLSKVAFLAKLVAVAPFTNNSGIIGIFFPIKRDFNMVQYGFPLPLEAAILLTKRLY